MYIYIYIIYRSLYRCIETTADETKRPDGNMRSNPVASPPGHRGKAREFF